MQNEILICFLFIVDFFDEFNILQKMYSKETILLHQYRW